ncbi:hypothetical protein QYE76_028234 [Lolium multiflorum]|uniref:Fe2OG dioxygenase domain-containing protein n=1 Tax=Lolium multiflorum TaxID=4521 RepID=A0AAD8QKK8_LOLMU|nr:hypothetical protein QYE76_028234 [Lolium multiflorum]
MDKSVQVLASLVDTLPPEFVRPEHQQPGATTFSGAAEVPLIDMSMSNAGCCVAEAAREWGIFQVVNHGVPSEAVAELQRVGIEFFALPQEEKERHALDPASKLRTEGYGFTLGRDSDAKKLWGEFLYNIAAPPAAVNLEMWPQNPHGYREANEAYYGHMQRLTRTLLERLSVELGLEQGAMAEALGGDDVVFLHKINFYPPCPQPELALGVPPHTDLCALTVLVPNEVQGLQVSKDGHWYDVNYVHGALIIFSNGRYKAVLHRAMVSKDKTRMSWPVFLEPPLEQVVGPHHQLVTDETPAKYKANEFKHYRYRKFNKLPL